MAKKKIGLVLSGGVAWGLAHVGVIKVLEREKIPIDCIAGTSIGALIGALYAAEPNAKLLEKFALEQSKHWRYIFDFTLSKAGFIKGNIIERILSEKFKKVTFSDLKIPLYISALDIENNQEIIFHKGDLTRAIHASIAIPGLFVPVENNGRILVDGGVIDPIPIEVLKNNGAHRVIAVNVLPMNEKKIPLYEEAQTSERKTKSPNLIHTLIRTFSSMQIEAARAELALQRADVIISPRFAAQTRWMDFEKTHDMIKIGEAAARKALPALRTMVEPNPVKKFVSQVGKELGVHTLVKRVSQELQNNKI